MITGELNSSFLNTGCLSISSNLLYRCCTSSEGYEDAVCPMEKSGHVDANPPAATFDRNFRLLIPMKCGILMIY